MEEKNMSNNPENATDTDFQDGLETDNLRDEGTADSQNDEGSEARSETAKLQLELQESKDKYLRLVAEFDNFRKRNAKERIELLQTAGKEVITSLLDVLDDSERAQKQLEQSADPAKQKEGVMLVFNKLRQTLQGKGLKSMTSIGETFDADKHEAITEIPAPQPGMAGKVIDEVQKGYYLNDKIIRYAKVVVGK